MVKVKLNWPRSLYVAGIVLMIIGAIDPMEGSALILAGSIFTITATYLRNDRHKKIFLINGILILTGVFFLFFLSALGGIGGTSDTSGWWGILILPYPIGWISNMVLLISRWVKKNEIRKQAIH